MPDELDMSTLFLVHEIESGTNPEINQGIYAKIWGRDCE